MSNIEGLDAKPPSKLTIVSSDNKPFEVPRNAALMSQLIKTSLENDKDASEIPIMSVDAATLDKIVEFMRYHNGVDIPVIPKPLSSSKMSELVTDQWDAKFIDSVPQGLLYNIILAANYMHMPGLLHLACAKVGTLLRGKPVDKIHQILSVEPQAAAAKKA